MIDLNYRVVGRRQRSICNSLLIVGGNHIRNQLGHSLNIYLMNTSNFTTIYPSEFGFISKYPCCNITFCPIVYFNFIISLFGARVWCWLLHFGSLRLLRGLATTLKRSHDNRQLYRAATIAIFLFFFSSGPSVSLFLLGL